MNTLSGTGDLTQCPDQTPKEPFTTRLDRRVRYWVDGLVIGSELFVRNAPVQTRGRVKMAKRRLVRARSPDQQPEPLYCFRQLRVLLE